MEIRYQLPTNEYHTLQKKISKRIYKGNKMVRRLYFYDVLLFLPFIVLTVIISMKIIELNDILTDYYDIDYAHWFAWLLLIGTYLVVLYAEILRPAFVNKIFRHQVADEITSGEQVIRLQEEGLYLQNRFVSSIYSYTKVRALENIDNFLTIFVAKGLFVAIPHNAFTDQSQRLAFENLLKQKMAQNEYLPD